MKFGSPPQLQEQVNDLACLFSQDERTQLLARLTSIEKLFPQIRIDIFTTALEPGIDLRTYCFWIFNASQIGPIELQADDAGGHRILLTIDAANGRANCLLGYGLEPFVSEEHVEKSLAAGAGHFARSKFFPGSLEILSRLETTLSRIHTNLGRTYGIDMREFQHQDWD